MNGKSITRPGLAAAVALLMGASMAPPASAHSWSHQNRPPATRTVVTGLVPPGLGLAVSGHGTVYVSQSFAGVVTKVKPHGRTQDVVAEEGTFPSGLDLGARNSLFYLSSGPAGGLLKVLRKGRSRTVADVSSYELANNPDQVNSYGFQDLSPQCLDQLPPSPPPGSDPEEGPPDLRPHPGDVNPNPYAVLADSRGGAIVADAGGNDLLRVSANGRVRLLTVLPPVPLKMTAQMVAALDLPTCTTGATFNFDPVPTDVERGPDGMLYVSGLPGGPEDDSLGARGVVFRVNPWNGRVKQVATGFRGAVDLAVDRHGHIYVAEIFGNSISKVVRGHARKVLDLPGPGALEYSHGRLYATAGDTSGEVVSWAAGA